MIPAAIQALQLALADDGGIGTHSSAHDVWLAILHCHSSSDLQPNETKLLKSCSASQSEVGVTTMQCLCMIKVIDACSRSELHLRDGLAPWLEQRDIARAQGALDAGVQGSQRITDAVQGCDCTAHSMTPSCCGEAALILLKQSLNGAYVTWRCHGLQRIINQQCTANMYTCMAYPQLYEANRAATPGSTRA